MRKTIVLASAAAVALTASSCYRDFDFNFDAKAEHTYIDVNGDWWDAEINTMVLDGQVGDIPVPADYDGNHEWDHAVVRANGDWVTNSPLGTINFPAPAQLPAFDTPDDPFDYHILPVPADYDGDGSANLAWYRDSDATWHIQGYPAFTFGTPPPPTEFGYSRDQDYPVPADYDGDGATDLSTFNARTMVWKIRSSIDGSVSTVTMEGNEYRPIPVPGDYDGVGHAQRAVVGFDGWAIEGHAELLQFGQDNGFNYPAVADYDGDGTVDLSYVSDEGVWYSDSSPTTYPVFTPYEPLLDYSVVAGHNLLTNIPRFNMYGRCDFDPAFCE